MTFLELEKIMEVRGVVTLADISRALNTTPQAVSNWKARDQVPYHIVAKLNETTPTNTHPPSSDPLSSSPVTRYSLPSAFEESSISFSDMLLTLAEQLKVILLVPFLTVFITFTHVQFIQQTYYISSSKILLPENQAISGGLAGLASQFGMNLSQGGGTVDLSSPALFPNLIKSRIFAERILKKPFYTEQYGKELSLLAILTHGDSSPTIEKETLIQNAMGAFQGMVLFENEGPFTVLKVKANEPRFARDVNKSVLTELQELNRFFKSQNVNQKVGFIESRIKVVKGDLEDSERSLKQFREQNQQISSPALQLQQERLMSSVEIQKGIYLTLRQQLELANIEKIQEETVVQILDEPQLPLHASGRNLRTSVLLAGVLGVGFGILLGFLRSYLNSGDIDERKKLRRVKNFLKKKGKDLIMDRRVSGIVSIFLLIGLPYYLGHKSQNPIFFGMYSSKLMLVNTVYVLALFSAISLFIYLTHRKNTN